MNKVKLSRERREFNWLTAVCLMTCVAASCGLEKCFKPRWLSCLFQPPWQKFIVGRSPSTAECILRWVRGAFRKDHFKSASPSPRLAWFFAGPAPNHMEKAYDCAKKNKPLSLPDVRKTQDVCELGATFLPFVWSLFGAASRPKPCRWLGFCEQKDLHGLTLRHKRLRSKLQLHLHPLVN